MNTTHATPPTEPQAIQPLLISADIPDASFTTISGDTLDLRAAVRNQPTVLAFFRGHW